jgi:hypothetical protein
MQGGSSVDGPDIADWQGQVQLQVLPGMQTTELRTVTCHVEEVAPEMLIVVVMLG